jgi:hypothetical protein
MNLFLEASGRRAALFQFRIVGDREAGGAP